MDRFHLCCSSLMIMFQSGTKPVCLQSMFLDTLDQPLLQRGPASRGAGQLRDQGLDMSMLDCNLSAWCSPGPLRLPSIGEQWPSTKHWFTPHTRCLRLLLISYSVSGRSSNFAGTLKSLMRCSASVRRTETCKLLGLFMHRHCVANNVQHFR